MFPIWPCTEITVLAPDLSSKSPVLSTCLSPFGGSGAGERSSRHHDTRVVRSSQFSIEGPEHDRRGKARGKDAGLELCGACMAQQEVQKLEERPEEAGRGAVTLSSLLGEAESPESPRGRKRSEHGPAFREVRGSPQSTVSWSQDAAAGGGGDWPNSLLLRGSR